MAFDYLKEIGAIRDEVRTTPNSMLGKIAQDFGEETIEIMKDGVPKASGALAASIGFEIEFSEEKFTISFYADDYYDYLNSGVDGVEESAGAIQNVYGSTYSFKTLNPSKSMVDAFSGNGSMQNWMASKGITSLTYGGKTHPLITDQDYKNAAYVLARGTKRHGIKPSEFINNAIAEDKLRKFEELLLDAFDNIN